MSKYIYAAVTILVVFQLGRYMAPEFRGDPAARLSGSPVPEQPDATPDLAAVLEPIRARNKIPAMGAAVIHGDRVVAIGATGVRKAGGETPVTARDLWHIGSCTKAMTATLIAILVEEGSLSWDQSVGEFFRGKVAEVHPSWDKVTLVHLLTHTAGAEANPSGANWRRLWDHKGPPEEARKELLEAILAKPTQAEPGAEFEYSNTGYTIAGAMAERASGTPWEALIQRKLFEPLGITSAGFGAPGTAGEHDQPLGHTDRGRAVEPGPGADNPAGMGPAGTVHMSLEDWAKFVAAHLLSSGGGLPASAFERLHTPPEGRDYAMGWATVTRPWAKGNGPGFVLTHAGSNTMWHAVAWLAPERKFAVVITCNQGGNKAARACDEAAAALLKAYPPDAEAVKTGESPAPAR